MSQSLVIDFAAETPGPAQPPELRRIRLVSRVLEWLFLILSVGAGEKRAVVHGDQIVAATVMTVTLTCDHRVVDGAIGAKWMQAFKPLIEDPLTMLA